MRVRVWDRDRARDGRGPALISERQKVIVLSLTSNPDPNPNPSWRAAIGPSEGYIGLGIGASLDLGEAEGDSPRVGSGGSRRRRRWSVEGPQRPVRSSIRGPGPRLTPPEARGSHRAQQHEQAAPTPHRVSTCPLCSWRICYTASPVCTKSRVYGLQQDTLRSVMFAFVMRLLNVSALLLTPVAAYITPPRANDGLVAAAHDEQARQRAEEPEI